MYECCYFHPKEVVVGVCCICLNEKLLILASKQGQLLSKSTLRNLSFTRWNKKNKNKYPPIITLPKIFHLTNYSFLPRFKFRHRQPPADIYHTDDCDDDDDDSTSTNSQEGMDIYIFFLSWVLFFFVCKLTYTITTGERLMLYLRLVRFKLENIKFWGVGAFRTIHSLFLCLIFCC